MSTARSVRLVGLLAGLLTVLAAGCVDRKFIIESNVPNAQIYIDNKSIGAAPAYAPFEYYGYYTITAVHPGYETLVIRKHVEAPWYAYPPFDFITEVLWPFPIRDTRRINIDLVPAVQARNDDILNSAEALRQRGMTLPPPERPAVPRPPGNPPIVIQPPVEPGVGPRPVPLPPPTPLPSPVPGPVPGVIPNVNPG